VQHDLGGGKRRKTEFLTDLDHASGSDAVCQCCDSRALDEREVVAASWS
jgi:hypothetical protein